VTQTEQASDTAEPVEPAGIDVDQIPTKLPRRPAFPPQFLVVLAFALGVLALEPTTELGYHLWGPSAPVMLGEPGDYRMEQASDGAFAKMSGLVGGQRAYYAEGGVRYVVAPMLGTAVLVRRIDDGTRLPADVVERYEASGRLVRLDDEPSNVFVRMFRPAARYTRMRQKFDVSLPAGRDAYLLLDGEAPRSQAGPILRPLLAWGLVGLALAWAVRSARKRREYDETMRRLRKLL
jgi:hypothetical protein